MRTIGKKYGPNNEYGCLTVLDPRLEGTFRVRAFPDIEMRVHPNCDGLICHDGEVVVQSKNGPDDSWCDFAREQQSKVIECLLEFDSPAVPKERKPFTRAYVVSSGKSYSTKARITIVKSSVRVSTWTEWSGESDPEPGIGMSVENVSRDGANHFAEVADQMLAGYGLKQLLLSIYDEIGWK